MGLVAAATKCPRPVASLVGAVKAAAVAVKVAGVIVAQYRRPRQHKLSMCGINLCRISRSQPIKYQYLITGKSYEQVWRLPGGTTVQLDDIENGYVIDPKWAGQNDKAFASSPFSPRF